MLPHVVVRTPTLSAVQDGDADTAIHAWVHIARGAIVFCDVAHLPRCPHQVVHCLTIDDHLWRTNEFCRMQVGQNWYVKLSSGCCDERPPGERSLWLQTTVMRDPCDERPLGWVNTVIRDHCDERPPGWETTVTRDHCDERPLGWVTTVIRNHCDERPLW